MAFTKPDGVGSMRAASLACWMLDLVGTFGIGALSSVRGQGQRCMEAAAIASPHVEIPGGGQYDVRRVLRERLQPHARDRIRGAGKFIQVHPASGGDVPVRLEPVLPQYDGVERQGAHI